MMRYFYWICFLVMGTALPVLAKNNGSNAPLPPASSKAGNKAIPTASASSATAAALAKSQIHKNAEVTLTADVSRGAASASLLAKQEPAQKEPAKKEHALPTPTVTVHNESHPASAPQPVIRNSMVLTYGSPATALRTASGPITTESDSFSGMSRAEKRLARVTAYWSDEGDYYTGRGMSATGVRLHDGLCAVDPNIIPYGSVVEIAGVGKYLAVDTGSAVIERTAAREGGHTSAERSAIVVDIYFEDRSEGERFAAGAAKYVSVTWWTPRSVGSEAKAARSLFADENWTKIESKQL